MQKLRIILTACGCPGASTLIRMLKNNGEREIEIIGTDMDPEAIGRYLTDKFHLVPSGNSKEYITRMLQIVEQENPDLIFPQSTYEVYPLSLHKKDFEKKGTPILVSDPAPLEIANNKYKMYETLRRQTNLDLPKYFLVNNIQDFTEALKQLDYPQKPIIFKPPFGKGSRGVRIIDSKINRKQILMETKPTSKYMTLTEFHQIFENTPDFPPLLVTEFIPGQEKTTDSICLNGDNLLTTVKTVEHARWGVIVRGELIKDNKLTEETTQILKTIPLSYCINIQFIDDKLIEINPRVSSFIYQKNMIMPYLAIKLLLNEITPHEITSLSSHIDYGRRMIRYMDQIFHKKNKQVL